MNCLSVRISCGGCPKVVCSNMDDIQVWSLDHFLESIKALGWVKYATARTPDRRKDIYLCADCAKKKARKL